MKANELINSVFKRLGTPLPQDIQTILSGSLSAIDVDAEVEKKFNVDFYTKESALQNPEIKNALRAEVLNGVDAQLELLTGKYEFDDATKDEFKKADKTAKKIEFLTDKIKEISEKKAGSGKVDKDAYTKEVEKYNAEILSLKTLHKTELDEQVTGRKTDRVNWELDSLYNGFEYSVHENKELAIPMAKAVLDMKIKEKGLKFDISDKGVKILTKEETDYYEDNKPVSPKDFMNKVFLENKLIKVNDAGKGNQNQHQNNGGGGQGNGGNNGGGKLSEYQVALNAAKVDAGLV